MKKIILLNLLILFIEKKLISFIKISKKFISLFLFLIFLFSDINFSQTDFPKPIGFVNDFANVIHDTYKRQMELIARELEQKTGVEIAVVTVKTTGDMDYNEYANRLYEKWGIGKKDVDEGVLILNAVEDRTIRIETGYGVEGILPDSLCGEIRDRYLIPFLKQDRYGEGLLNGMLAVVSVIAKDKGVALSSESLFEKVAQIDIAKNNYDKGIKAFENKDYSSAIEFFTKALEIDPKRADAYYWRGASFNILGKYKEAMHDISKAKEIDPNNILVYYIRGTIYDNLGRHKEAIKDFTKAIEIDPNYVSVYNNRGNSFSHLEKYEEAIKDYSKAIEINPKFAEFYNNRGLAYNNLVKHEEAIIDYTKAIELDPKYVNTYYNRGFSNSYLGKNKEAADDFNSYLRLYGKCDEKSEEVIQWVKELGYEPYMEGKGISVTTSDAQEDNIEDISESVIDIYENIPKASTVNNDAIAVVIGNRDYIKKDVPSVNFAEQDAQLVKQYLIKTLGYREGNIIFLTNATQADFIGTFGTEKNYKGKLFNYVKENKSDVFIYYSGHGAPDPESKLGYFIPVDCDPSFITLNGYSLDTFYENLSRIPFRTLTVVIDACFSGSSEGGMLLKNISPVGIKIKNPLLIRENSVIITSSTGVQVSSWYPEMNHSLFTYYFLKAIQGAADFNNDKKISAGEIKKYIDDNVPYMARRLHNREQTPQFIGDGSKVIVEY